MTNAVKKTELKKIELQEMASPNGFWVSDNNFVMLFIRIAGGFSMFTDDTCQSYAAITHFMQQDSRLSEKNAALDMTSSYETILNEDIKTLKENGFDTLAVNAEARLRQVKLNIRLINLILKITRWNTSNFYSFPQEIINLITSANSNLSSFLLNPEIQDGCIKSLRRRCTFDRGRVDNFYQTSHQIFNEIRNDLPVIAAYSKDHFLKDLRIKFTKFRDQRLGEFLLSSQETNGKEGLREFCAQVYAEKCTFGPQNPFLIDRTFYNNRIKERLEYFEGYTNDTVILQGNTAIEFNAYSKATPEERNAAAENNARIHDTLLLVFNTCDVNDEMFLPPSLSSKDSFFDRFSQIKKSGGSSPDHVDNLSMMVQFHIAIANLYLSDVAKLTERNFGNVLDKNLTLRNDLLTEVKKVLLCKKYALLKTEKEKSDLVKKHSILQNLSSQKLLELSRKRIETVILEFINNKKTDFGINNNTDLIPLGDTIDDLANEVSLIQFALPRPHADEGTLLLDIANALFRTLQGYIGLDPFTLLEQPIFKNNLEMQAFLKEPEVAAWVKGCKEALAKQGTRLEGRPAWKRHIDLSPAAIKKQIDTALSSNNLALLQICLLKTQNQYIFQTLGTAYFQELRAKYSNANLMLLSLQENNINDSELLNLYRNVVFGVSGKECLLLNSEQERTLLTAIMDRQPLPVVRVYESFSKSSIEYKLEAIKELGLRNRNAEDQRAYNEYTLNYDRVNEVNVIPVPGQSHFVLEADPEVIGVIRTILGDNATTEYFNIEDAASFYKRAAEIWGPNSEEIRNLNDITKFNNNDPDDQEHRPAKFIEALRLCGFVRIANECRIRYNNTKNYDHVFMDRQNKDDRTIKKKGGQGFEIEGLTRDEIQALRNISARLTGKFILSRTMEQSLLSEVEKQAPHILQAYSTRSQKIEAALCLFGISYDELSYNGNDYVLQANKFAQSKLKYVFRLTDEKMMLINDEDREINGLDFVPSLISPNAQIRNATDPMSRNKALVQYIQTQKTHLRPNLLRFENTDSPNARSSTVPSNAINISRQDAAAIYAAVMQRTNILDATKVDQYAAPTDLIYLLQELKRTSELNGEFLGELDLEHCMIVENLRGEMSLSGPVKTLETITDVINRDQNTAAFSLSWMATFYKAFEAKFGRESEEYKFVQSLNNNVVDDPTPYKFIACSAFLEIDLEIAQIKYNNTINHLPYLSQANKNNSTIERKGGGGMVIGNISPISRGKAEIIAEEYMNLFVIDGFYEFAIEDAFTNIMTSFGVNRAQKQWIDTLIQACSLPENQNSDREDALRTRALQLEIKMILMGIKSVRVIPNIGSKPGQEYFKIEASAVDQSKIKFLLHKYMEEQNITPELSIFNKTDTNNTKDYRPETEFATNIVEHLGKTFAAFRDSKKDWPALPQINRIVPGHVLGQIGKETASKTKLQEVKNLLGKIRDNQIKKLSNEGLRTGSNIPENSYFETHYESIRLPKTKLKLTVGYGNNNRVIRNPLLQPSNVSSNASGHNSAPSSSARTTAVNQPISSIPPSNASMNSAVHNPSVPSSNARTTAANQPPSIPLSNASMNPSGHNPSAQSSSARTTAVNQPPLLSQSNNNSQFFRPTSSTSNTHTGSQRPIYSRGGENRPPNAARRSILPAILGLGALGTGIFLVYHPSVILPVIALIIVALICSMIISRLRPPAVLEENASRNRYNFSIP